VKVTVITVVRNRVGAVGEALDAVAAQSHPSVEHIVVDGASTDGTLEVLRARKDQIARVISEPDRGIYDALNKGVAVATGDIIGILHVGDVYAHAHVLADVVKAMTNGGYDAVLGDVAFVAESDPTRIVRRYRSDRFRPSRLAWGWMPAHPSLFVRRQIYTRVGPFRIDFKIAGDFEWIVRAFTRGPLRYTHVPEVLVRMRTGGVSTSGWRSTILLNQEVMRACRENGVDTSWMKLLSKYPAKLLEFFPS
jgi:glycosyltransferase involved in cell wall biosynthesis